jgi:hypothetical protein
MGTIGDVAFYYSHWLILLDRKSLQIRWSPYGSLAANLSSHVAFVREAESNMVKSRTIYKSGYTNQSEEGRMPPLSGVQITNNEQQRQPPFWDTGRHLSRVFANRGRDSESHPPSSRHTGQRIWPHALQRIPDASSTKFETNGRNRKQTTA